MSLRRFMHPRNKYKEEPNFKKLAILYPEFRKIAIMDLAGKVRINFKDLESLRILAKTLLKHDFDIDVDIPLTNLVPAVPSRLNYVLWIEDLAKYSGVTDMSSISGIDIGTGAVCIYPLLMAKIYSCKIIGTELNEESFYSAISNIRRNKLEELVKVIRSDKETILGCCFKNEEKNNSYTFTMCNPPFFCAQETSLVSESETESTRIRMPARNARSGSEVELIVEGGETQFVSRMVNESFDIKDRVKIYTTMLGKKSSLLFLLKEFNKLNIVNSTWTEFCQGHTTRWGLAWSFLPKSILDLTKAPVIRISNSKDKLNHKINKKPPSEIVFKSRNGLESKEDLVNNLKRIFIELKIRVEELHLAKPEANCWGCRLMIDEDSWSHERRRKRKMRLNESLSEIPPSKKASLEESLDINISDVESRVGLSSNGVIVDEIITTKGSLLTCNLFVVDINSDDDDKTNKKILKISMDFESGTGGRNSMETLRQYFINKFHIRDELINESNNASKKLQNKRRVRKKKK